MSSYRGRSGTIGRSQVGHPVASAVGGMAALAAAVGIGRFVYTPILPAMIDGLGLSKAEAGLIASANFIGYLAGAVLAATPGLPGSRRAWLLAALAVGCITTGAMGLTASLPAFLALRCPGGAASAFVLVFASTLVLDCLAQAGRSNLAAVHFAGVGVGITLSAMLVSALLAAGAGWRVLWLAAGAISLVLACSAWLIPGSKALPTATPLSSAASGGPSKPVLATVAWSYGLFGFGYVVTATFLVTIVRANAELRSVEPLVWLFVGLSATPSVAVWTRIGRRLGIMRAFGIACAIEAVGVAASVLSPTIGGALLSALLLGGTFMGITALGLAAGRRLAADGDPRRALGLLTAAFGTGQIAGPALAGYLHDWSGGFAAPSLLAAAALIMAAANAIRVPLPPADS